jgi:hypothetical protein
MEQSAVQDGGADEVEEAFETGLGGGQLAYSRRSFQ